MCKVQDRVNELVDASGIKLSVVVSTNLVGVTAGDCDGYGRKIRINKVLLKPHLAEELDETIVHEVAHAVDIQRNGYRRDSRGKAIHHDKVFYSIMAELGYPNAKRTHDIKELKPSRVYRQFKYACDIEGCKDTHILKTPSHNKLQNAGINDPKWYKYRKCGGKVYKTTFVKEIHENNV